MQFCIATMLANTNAAETSKIARSRLNIAQQIERINSRMPSR